MNVHTRGPLVRHNDWRAIVPPPLGGFTPTKSVSVVIPSWGGRHLPSVFAALSAQTYPSHLTEVVVVDDGNPTPLVLPELRPDNARLLRVEHGWGRAGASQVGMDASEGEVVLWLDDDMLPFGDHVEAHARWHHVTDNAVVMGVKRFVDPNVPLTPEQVRAAVLDGTIGELHDWDASVRHEWVEKIWEESGDLAEAGFGGFRCFVSATASMSRAMVRAVGPVNADLKLGEDTEYGHRLGQTGGVLVPEHGARAWHLGNSHAMEDTETVNRYNQPAFAELVPSLRRRRMSRGRAYRVPYVQVVVPGDGPLREVQRSLDSILDSDLFDLQVLLVGPWDQLDDGRVSPLTDPLRDLKIVHRRYVHEPRVRLVTPDDEALRSRPDATFRLVVGRVDVAPVAGALRAWTDDAERARLGLRVFTDSYGAPVARLERVAAFARVEWHGASFFSDSASVADHAADDLVDEAFGVARVPAEEAGWVPWRTRTVPRDRRSDVVAVDPEESWSMALEAMGIVEGRDVAAVPGVDDDGRRHPGRGLLGLLRGR